MELRRSWPSSRRGGWDDCRVDSASGARVLRAARSRAHDPNRPAGPRRDCRAAGPLQPHARAGACGGGAVRGSRPAADRPPRAGRVVPAAAGDHGGQPRRADRLGHLLPGDRRRAASYEIANFIQAIEQLTVTTLRNVIGGMTLEQTLTSRDSINSELRIVLDEATGKWGIRVNRVELKAVDPPPSIQEAMEKQMRAERDRRAAILQAEGVKQSQ